MSYNIGAQVFMIKDGVLKRRKIIRQDTKTIYIVVPFVNLDPRMQQRTDRVKESEFLTLEEAKEKLIHMENLRHKKRLKEIDEVTEVLPTNPE